MKPKNLAWIIVAPLVSATVVLLLLAACSTQHQNQSARQTPAQTATTARPMKGGAQLWAENCNRCHNFRSPGTYSDAQWDVAMDHMRVIGNLTADDSRAILSFLKAGN